MLVDSHAHLTDERLAPDVEAVTASMRADNVEKIISSGYDTESSVGSVALSKRFGGVYSTVGIHPHDAQYATQDDYRLFEALAEEPKTVAIGEIGLDYFYDKSPREIQKRVFAEQLELAESVKLPVVLHVRDAYGDALAVLKDNVSKLKYGGLLHCYGGSEELLKEFFRLGLFVSYGGAITFKNAAVRREVAANTPLDRVLVETDCPYLTPEPYRGRRNEPKYVNFVAEKLAEICGIEKEAVEESTTANAVRLFPKLKNE